MKEGIESITTFIHKCKDKPSSVDILATSREHKWRVIPKGIVGNSLLEGINHCPYCGFDLVSAVRNREWKQT